MLTDEISMCKAPQSSTISTIDALANCVWLWKGVFLNLTVLHCMHIYLSNTVAYVQWYC